MDLGKYKLLKEKGLIRLQLLGEQVIVISKRYDSDTGAQLKDNVIPVDEKALLEQKVTLGGQLEAIAEFLEDIEVAKG